MKRSIAAVILAYCVLAWPRLEAQRPVFNSGTLAELAEARSIGLEHVRRIGAQKGITGTNDLVVSRADIDRLSMAHTRIQQYVRGVPVFGGEAIAHLNQAGEPFAETDSLVSDVSVDTTPRLTPAAAIDIAITDYGCRDCLTAVPTTDLWILRDQGVDHLVYRVQLARIDGTRDTALPVRFVDAHGGYVVLS